MRKQVYIKVIGRVQGVFFRAETQDRARELGLVGWVRNSPDGGVEILAQGEEAMLQKLIDWCRKGPDRSSVDNVLVEWKEIGETFPDFSILF